MKPPPALPLFEVKALTRNVQQSGYQKKLVDNFSFTFAPGNIYTILGPSGAGKSSLLRLFNRLDEPSSGEIFFDGLEYRQINTCSLRRKIGYLFQVPYLFAGSIKDNLLKAEPSLSDQEIENLLNISAIELSQLNKPTENLSVGEMQRVALARMMATSPKVILLDEPTASLDPTYTAIVEKSIKSIAHTKTRIVIMVSHQPEQALRMGGIGLLIVNGRLIESSRISDLLTNPKTNEGKRYRDRKLK